MKKTSQELIDFLASDEGKKLKIADLYTFVLTSGQEIRFTSADFDIIHNDKVFSHKNAGVSRSDMSWQSGLSVDDVTIELNPGPNDKVGSVTLVEAFRNGTFDGASIQLDMAFYSEGWNKPPLILEKLFVGNVDVDEVSGSYVKLNIKSLTELLNTNFPSDVYQTACHYSLYSSGCDVSKTNYSEKCLAESGSAKKEIKCYLNRDDGYYQNGVIHFTSGLNINVKKSVKIQTRSLVVLSTPLQYPPKKGDSFTISAGCDKTMSTCKSKFNNLDNFSGTPFIPNPDSSI